MKKVSSSSADSDRNFGNEIKGGGNSPKTKSNNILSIYLSMHQHIYVSMYLIRNILIMKEIIVLNQEKRKIKKMMILEPYLMLKLKM
jgi:hypothetical protein